MMKAYKGIAQDIRTWMANQEDKNIVKKGGRQPPNPPPPPQASEHPPGPPRSSGQGIGQLSRLQSAIDNWVSRISDDPNLWADDDDMALIELASPSVIRRWEA